MKKEIGIVAVALLFVLAMAWFLNRGTASSNPHIYDTFASCVAESGATFYGAFWCPHCREQKAMFEDSVKLLPYVECSNQDGKTQTQVCVDKKITSYPTWIFKNGDRVSGVLELAVLSAKTACVLPHSTTTPVVPQTASTTNASSTPVVGQ